MKVDAMSVWCGDAWELVLCVSAVLQSSPLANQKKKKTVPPQMDRRFKIDSYLFWTCINKARPTLSGFSSIQFFTVFRAMSAAGSLGKPRKKTTVNTSCIQHVDARGRQKQIGEQTDKPISPQIIVFLLNKLKQHKLPVFWWWDRKTHIQTCFQGYISQDIADIQCII